jgi:proteasome lid subunit RPN8/RPN11
MAKEVIRLPRTLVNQLLRLAQISPEREVCGLIGARAGLATTCYPVTNIAEMPAIRYELDPRQQIDAMHRMRERNEELFAIYHSHPSSPAEPSSTDKILATYPDALYLIISLNIEGVLEMRGFRLRSNRRSYETQLVLY